METSVQHLLLHLQVILIPGGGGEKGSEQEVKRIIPEDGFGFKRKSCVADGIIRVSTTGGRIHEPWHGIDTRTKEPPPQTEVSGQKLDLHQGLPEAPMQHFLIRVARRVYSAQLFSRTVNNPCFGDVKSLLLAQQKVCVKTVSATTLDGSNNTAAEAEDVRGMSESPMFEIPVTHFGFDRNANCTQRGTKQLGFQG